ncbi:hypothetical protein HMPREF1624_06185 [Sporothrix schenckii ATCC 58251]|uniref:DUF7820 domain-containing protein n=2 Tax=Sporothrix schenckii TaxID=29908 RepID=U7PR03_SPOS1|nr:hypothetical protein HMPREF1624_06185 [Sporothrix schenckii ATCC 58251]
MYPQNVRMARTLSGATTSTVAPSDSSYSGPRGPTFPYGLYQQNTMAGPSALPVTDIPVGFPSMADNYRRRIGPDGEDVADLIGPDGHTEQLPPYTRYPDEAYTRKIAAANVQPHYDPLADPLAGSVASGPTAPNTVPVAVPAAVQAAVPDPTQVQPVTSPGETASTSAHIAVPAPIQLIPGAGGIGLASRNPEFDGVEGAESPRSRYSLRSFTTEGSGREINTEARNISEKRKHKAPHFVQRYGGRRILGVIPYWAICLVITALLLMGIVLGAVIGTFVSRHRRAQELHHSNNNGPVSVTVTVDATPIPTPTNLPGLPTGTFGLPFQINESPGACFNDTTQAQAWKCGIANQYSMTLTVNSLPLTPDGPMYDISIHCNESATYENNLFFYGEQAPTIKSRAPLLLVNDTLDLNRGPAWFKMMPYNKTVIVRESFLSAPNAQPTTEASTTNNNKRGAGGLTGSLSFDAAGPFGRKGAMLAQAGDKPWVCTWPDTILEIFIYPNQNTSMYRLSLSSTYTPSTTTPTPTQMNPSSTGAAADGGAATATESNSSATSTPPLFPNAPPPYPRVVKMEERRMANSPQATCMQYELKLEGTSLKAVPNRDASGQPIQVTISEIESGPSLFSQGKRDIMGAGEVFEKRDESGLSKCGCLWMVT